VLHAIANYTNFVHISANDRLSLLYSCGAIGAVRDIFSALLNGATLCPFDVKERGLHELADWLNREEISMYNSVTTLFRQLGSVLPSARRFPHLRLVKFGGEGATRRDVELFRRLCSPGSFLYIGLAATETGGSVRAFFIDHGTPLTWSVPPLGYPVDGIETILLDEDGRSVERGSIGEIAVKGRHLAVGYWRQPDLTRAAFLPDPAGSDARIYRTGDLGRLLPDGCLEYLGRKDFQIKVRGNRVEAAEVELALLEHGTLKEAVVVARQEQAEHARLVAYVVPSTLPPPPVPELRRFLAEKLPEHMVPTMFVVLDALPLTPNGKLDRRALPTPPNARPALARAYAHPRTPMETELARLWAQVLDLEQVGVHDNFLDLGGHSLSAMRIVARVRDTWHVDLPLRLLLEDLTVADMALAIAQYLASATDPELLDRPLTDGEALSEGTRQPQRSDPTRREAQ
jgi:acyl-coenzyme A synthetase/AMP-(fatty) acid ligase/acyl carrier protein